MSHQFSTAAVHAGENGRKPFGAVTTPIVQSSTFTFRDSAEIQEFMESKAIGGRVEHYEYGRYANPTQRAAEEKLAALEGGELALPAGRGCVHCGPGPFRGRRGNHELGHAGGGVGRHPPQPCVSP